VPPVFDKKGGFIIPKSLKVVKDSDYAGMFYLPYRDNSDIFISEF
jgi:hypothetical protein